MRRSFVSEGVFHSLLPRLFAAELRPSDLCNQGRFKNLLLVPFSFLLISDKVATFVSVIQSKKNDPSFSTGKTFELFL